MDLIAKKLKEYLEVDSETAEKIFNQLALYMYSLEQDKHDLFLLAQILPEEHLNKLIAYYDGDTIKLPSKEQHRSLLFTAICYYLKYIKGYNWNVIKEMLDLPENSQNMLSSISIGRKMNNLQNQISKEFLNILKTTKVTNMDSFVNKLKEESK